MLNGMAMAVRPLTLHVGTYTDGASKGIYRLDFDPQTGALGEPVLAAEAVNPAFLAASASAGALRGERDGHEGRISRAG